MITAFEAGAVFRLQDEFSANLRRMAEEVRAFAALIKETKTQIASLGRIKFPGLNAEMKGLKDQAESVAKTFGATFTSIDTAAQGTKTEVGRLTAEWAALEKQVASTGRTMSGINLGGAMPGGNPRQRIAGSHGGAGTSGVHVSSFGTPIPGGHAYLRGGNNAAMAGGLALGYGTLEGFTASDLIWKGLANVFPEGTPEDRGRRAAELLGIVKREATIIGQSPSTVAKMALDEIKVNAGLPWKERLAMMPQVIESGAREAYVKGLSSPESAVSAFVGQLHQAKAFTPEEVQKLGPVLAYFAARDPNSIVNIAKSSAYHLPTLTAAMGVPVTEDLAAQTTLDQLGVGGKSGTWIRQMALKAAHPYLPLNASKEQVARYNQQMAELKSLGLIDASGKSTIMRDGHYSTEMLLHQLGESLKGVPIDVRANKLQKVFGARGSYSIAALTDQKMLQRYDQTLGGAGRISSNEDFWREQNKYNPMQQARSAFSNLQGVLLEIGQNTLPTVVDLLKGFDAGLSGLNNTLGSGMLSRIIGVGIGAYAGGKFGPTGAVIGGVAGGALAGGGLPQIGPKSSAPELLDLLTKQNNDAAKKTEGATEKGAERGVLQGFWDFLKKGVSPGGFSPPQPGTPLLQRENFQVPMPPSGSKTPIHFSSAINLDGVQLAQVVASKFAELYENSNVSPAANGVAMLDINGGYTAS